MGAAPKRLQFPDVPNAVAGYLCTSQLAGSAFLRGDRGTVRPPTPLMRQERASYLPATYPGQKSATDVSGSVALPSLADQANTLLPPSRGTQEQVVGHVPLIRPSTGCGRCTAPTGRCSPVQVQRLQFQHHHGAGGVLRQRLVDAQPDASLPPMQAEVIMLRVLAGLDTEAVAQLLGRSSGAIRIAAHRGLHRLASLLAEAGVTQ